jgi:hypothetical protein
MGLLLMVILLFSSPDFDLLQGSKGREWSQLRKRDRDTLDFYRALFYKNFPQSEVKQMRIPNTLHFIWLGLRPFPRESIKNVESWMRFHPEWTIKFWSDDPHRPCPVQGMEKHLVTELSNTEMYSFMDRTTNYGEKSDLLRYEILHREGGVYVDHDVECFAAFTSLNRTHDFYCGLEAPHKAEGIKSRIFCCNCLIGAIPGHPILKRTMEHIAERWEYLQAKYAHHEGARVMARTFASFSDAVRSCAEEGDNLIFPAFYFFPNQVYDKELQKKLHLNGRFMASHEFAGVWHPPTIKDPIKQLKNAEMKLMKKVNLLTCLSSASLLLSSFLCVLFFRRRPKM